MVFTSQGCVVACGTYEELTQHMDLSVFPPKTEQQRKNLTPEFERHWSSTPSLKEENKTRYSTEHNIGEMVIFTTLVGGRGMPIKKDVFPSWGYIRSKIFNITELIFIESG